MRLCGDCMLPKDVTSYVAHTCLAVSRLLLPADSASNGAALVVSQAVCFHATAAPVQVVGVVDPAWRPVWFARGRNAIIRGVFGRGRDPHMLLSSWVQHCIEEVSCNWKLPVGAALKAAAAGPGWHNNHHS